MSKPGWVLLGALLLGLWSAACRGPATGKKVVIVEGEGRDAVIGLLLRSRNYQARFGWEADPETSLPFQHIWEGRVAGDRVVFADYEPPVLRAFNLDGEQRWTAASKGDGPGEARHPRDLAVSSEGDVLLLHDENRLSLFDNDGHFRATYRMLSGRPLAVGPGCEGKSWLVYGPGEVGVDHPVPWLRQLRFHADSVTLDTLWMSPAPPEQPPYRDRYRLLPVDGRIDFDHPYGPGGGLLSWSCDTREALVRSPVTYRSSAPAARQVGEEGGRRLVAVSLRTDVPYPSGRVEVNQAVLRTYTVLYDRRVGGSVTYLRMSLDGLTYQVRVPGTCVFLDAWPDGRVLVSRSSDMAKEAFVIDGQSLVEAILEGAAGESRIQPDDTLFTRGFE